MLKSLTQLIHVVTLSGVLSLGGCYNANADMAPSDDEATQAQISTVRTHTIEITKFKYIQAELAVQPGDTVTWVNNDIVPHTATALDKSWDTGLLAKGDSATLTITKDMSLDYFCVYHPNMTAKLVWVEKGAGS